MLQPDEKTVDAKTSMASKFRKVWGFIREVPFIFVYILSD